MATATPNEVYVITTNETFRLSNVTGLRMDVPNERLGDYFNNWGLTLFMDGGYQIEERFETEEFALCARTTIDEHLTGLVTVTGHLQWDTLKNTL